MNTKRQKLHAYIDESGQDTEGMFFVVGVVIISKEQEEIISTLHNIEKQSGKKNIKWRKSKPTFRRAYIEHIAATIQLCDFIFFELFTDSKKYIEMTSFATAHAIHEKTRGKKYHVNIFIDGFNRAEMKRFVYALRGIRNDESNAFIRLADAVCGLIRDAEDGDLWAGEIKKNYKKRSFSRPFKKQMPPWLGGRSYLTAC